MKMQKLFFAFLLHKFFHCSQPILFYTYAAAFFIFIALQNHAENLEIFF